MAEHSPSHRDRVRVGQGRTAVPRLTAARSTLAVSLAIVVACGALVATPGSASALTAEWFAGQGIESATFVPFAIQPQAVFRGGITYVAYQGQDYAPYAAAYDHTRGAWSGPVRAGSSRLRRDTHGAPCVWLDAPGRVHVLYGSHSSAQRHSVSRDRSSVAAWRYLPDLSGTYTYPQVVRVPSGSLGMLYRRRPTPGLWEWRTSTNGGYSWSGARAVLRAGSGQSWYASARKGDDGRVHLAFMRAEMAEYGEATGWGRHDVFYLSGTGDGAWTDASRSTRVTSVPSWSAARSSFMVFDSGAAFTNMTMPGSVEGTPAVLYSTGSGEGPGSYVWRFARYVGGAWRHADILPTDHFFDGGTWAVESSGAVNAYLTAGDRPEPKAPARYAGRGGDIVWCRSVDGGATWSKVATISPQVPGAMFNHPQVVEDAHPDARVVFSRWTNRPSSSNLPVYVWGDHGTIGRAHAPSLSRIGGTDRYRVNVRSSFFSYQIARPVPRVFVASGRIPYDALAAAPVADAEDAPLLLVGSGRLPAATISELRRLKPARIVVVGGQASVPDAVVGGLRHAVPTARISRVSGADRYEVAARLAARLGPSDTAVISNGARPADALAAGPLAARLGAPLLFVTARSIPSATARSLAARAVTRTVVVGGTCSVGSRVASALAAPVRIGGADRYDVSRLVEGYGSEHALWSERAAVSSGRAWPDAVSGSQVACRVRGPLLLADDGAADAAAATLRERRALLHRVTMVGGPATLSDAVRDRLRAALAGR